MDFLSSVFCMDGDGIVEIVPVVLSVEIFLGVAHVEEVVEFSSSGWVVSVCAQNWSFLLWSLDVPEYVVWDGGEDLFFSCCLEAVAVGIFQIADVVIFGILEYRQFFIEDVFEA